jgi:3-oxoacyl-[acyl-carrier protein] reductase
MIERRFGRIVCLTSVAALRARPGAIAYSASKAAVVGFARSCSEAFAPDVRVNCVAPGLIDTDMAARLSEDRRRAFVEATPLGRLGRADEIAEMAAFLLSERSSFTSGQVMIASGGRITLP